MANDDDGAGGGEERADLVPRPPEEEDLVDLCRRLNETGAKYVVIGGYAIIHAGYPRMTGDLDLLIDVSPDNVAKVYEALRSLPDRAVDELEAEDVARYTVVRVADEIVVDLMKSAGGVSYDEASCDIVVREVRGVEIPFASARLLWLMKCQTHREKDALDLLFLRKLFEERGEKPPGEK